MRTYLQAKRVGDDNNSPCNLTFHCAACGVSKPIIEYHPSHMHGWRPNVDSVNLFLLMEWMGLFMMEHSDCKSGHAS